MTDNPRSANKSTNRFVGLARGGGNISIAVSLRRIWCSGRASSNEAATPARINSFRARLSASAPAVSRLATALMSMTTARAPRPCETISSAFRSSVLDARNIQPPVRAMRLTPPLSRRVSSGGSASISVAMTPRRGSFRAIAGAGLAKNHGAGASSAKVDGLLRLALSRLLDLRAISRRLNDSVRTITARRQKACKSSYLRRWPMSSA